MTTENDLKKYEILTIKMAIFRILADFNTTEQITMLKELAEMLEAEVKLGRI
jgi:hypothetical protein